MSTSLTTLKDFTIGCFTDSMNSLNMLCKRCPNCRLMKTKIRVKRLRRVQKSVWKKFKCNWPKWQDLLNRLVDTVNAGTIIPTGMSRKSSASNATRNARFRSSVAGTVGSSMHPEAKKNTDELQVGRDAKEFALLGPQIVSTFPQASGPLPRLAVDEDLDEEPIHFG
ncbi:hypothetical protein AHF37_11685 [Paragonimus kellicotti]|nr:hypothetical protein AHF37_11685 [Paragonimus kellicotti]